tara:strand:- start:152 stop:1228 length:1077 start_codon:yes stop_codon:yes gene_type:complete
MKKILIVTGGSGGHVMPALSIFDHLKNNFDTSLVTDKRGAKFINKSSYHYNLIDVPNLFSKIYLFPLNFIRFVISIFRSYFFLKKKNIDFLISTGGYMSLPLCIASKLLNIKIFLFEPNSVLGKSNKFILSISKKIICYDENIKLFPKKYLNKIYLMNPILRNEIYFSKKNKKKDFGIIKKILIIGGSQGARYFDEEITEAILKLSKLINIEICQQVFNIEEKYLIEQKYIKAGIKHKLFDFDDQLFNKISDYDLAISRSGASAIAELAFLNIPFVAIPFPFAKDDHQYFNAKFYESINSCWLIRQDSLNINNFVDLIFNLFTEKKDYFNKKDNLEKIYDENTWNNVNKKLLDLINEN